MKAPLYRGENTPCPVPPTRRRQRQQHVRGAGAGTQSLEQATGNATMRFGSAFQATMAGALEALVSCGQGRGISSAPLCPRWLCSGMGLTTVTPQGLLLCLCGTSMSWASLDPMSFPLVAREPLDPMSFPLVTQEPILDVEAPEAPRHLNS